MTLSHHEKCNHCYRPTRQACDHCSEPVCVTHGWTLVQKRLIKVDGQPGHVSSELCRNCRDVWLAGTGREWAAPKGYYA